MSEEDRVQAACLSRALFAAREAWRAGERDAAKLQAVLRRELGCSGIEIEYAELRGPEA